MEEYKYEEIIGYENYLIYENGQVFSKKNKRFLKPRVDRYGYLSIQISKNNQRKNVRIHRLIALYFIPNPENKRCVDHIDGNKANNSISNLRWASDSENCKNGKKRSHNTSGEKNVYWTEQTGKWAVSFSVNGKLKHFGYFDNFEEAVMTATRIRQELYGEYARDE